MKEGREEQRGEGGGERGGEGWREGEAGDEGPRGVVVVHEQEDEQAGGKNVANFRPATAERRAVSVSKRGQQTTPMKRRLGQRKG